jgi:hypothetical protein
MRLPPPDPNEPADSEPDGAAAVASPTIVFAAPPSRDAERLAAAILEARPGVLFVNCEE